MATWVGLAPGTGDSLGSLPHEHLTVCPLTSDPWIETIAWIADSLLENLEKWKPKYSGTSFQRILGYKVPQCTFPCDTLSQWSRILHIELVIIVKSWPPTEWKRNLSPWRLVSPQCIRMRWMFCELNRLENKTSNDFLKKKSSIMRRARISVALTAHAPSSGKPEMMLQSWPFQQMALKSENASDSCNPDLFLTLSPLFLLYLLSLLFHSSLFSCFFSPVARLYSLSLINSSLSSSNHWRV